MRAQVIVSQKPYRKQDRGTYPFYLGRFNPLTPNSSANDLPLHMAICPRDEEDDSSRTQMFLTTCPPDAWSDIWHIKMALRDRPGLLQIVTTLLGELDINILFSKICLGTVEFLADMSRYGEQGGPDGNKGSREADPEASLSWLQDYLTVKLWDDLDFQGSSPMLAIYRSMHWRRLAKRRFETYEVVIERNRYIELEAEPWERLFGSEPIRSGEIRMMVDYDPEEGFIRYTHLPDKSAAVLFEIEHPDQPGTLGDFSSRINSEKGLNILGAFLFPHKKGPHGRKIQRLRLLCEYTKGSYQTEQLKKLIGSKFGISKEDQKLGITVHFPKVEKPDYDYDTLEPGNKRRRPWPLSLFEKR